MSNAQYPRAARVRAIVHEVLAAEIERLKDPGVAFVTITDVTISPDLRNASVFYTVYGSDVERASTKDALQRATKHLRAVLGREVRLRYVPQLDFKEDPIPERSERLDRLIAELHKKEDV